MFSFTHPNIYNVLTNSLRIHAGHSNLPCTRKHGPSKQLKRTKNPVKSYVSFRNPVPSTVSSIVENQLTMDELVKQRDSVKSQLAKLLTKVNKHDVTPLDIFEVTICSTKLTKLSENCDSIHSKIVILCTTQAVHNMTIFE